MLINLFNNPKKTLGAVYNLLKANLRILNEMNSISHQVGLEQSRRVTSWIERSFTVPAPNYVKWQVLKKWGGNGAWIETGTYTGETTWFLSTIGSVVISLEPAKPLAMAAVRKFSSFKNVRIIEGTSEENLDLVLLSLEKNQKADISFWLDGHYSGGDTFLAEEECPVLKELEIIERHITEFQKISILIDDVRVFSPTGLIVNGYPSLSFLVAWADQKKLKWVIENDIFIMSNR